MRYPPASPAGVLAGITRTVAIGGLIVWALATAPPLPAATGLSQDEAPLSVILDKATGYVAAYAKAFSSVVSEERYEQRVTRKISRGGVPTETQLTSRTLVSDHLLVQAPGWSNEWMPFRDVCWVDGVPGPRNHLSHRPS